MSDKKSSKHRSRSKSKQKRRHSSSSSSSSSNDSSSSSTSSSSSDSSPKKRKKSRDHSASKRRRSESSKRKKDRKSRSSTDSKKLKRKRARSSSTSSSSSSPHRSKKKRKKQKKKKKKHKKTKVKEKKGTSKEFHQDLSLSSEKARRVSETDVAKEPQIHSVPNQGPKQRSMKPMTKEEWERQQSVVRRVYDTETGRHRLIKGDGEILEEIVSKEMHKKINKTATKGDGYSYAKNMGLQTWA